MHECYRIFWIDIEQCSCIRIFLEYDRSLPNILHSDRTILVGPGSFGDSHVRAVERYTFRLFCNLLWTIRVLGVFILAQPGCERLVVPVARRLHIFSRTFVVPIASPLR